MLAAVEANGMLLPKENVDFEASVSVVADAGAAVLVNPNENAFGGSAVEIVVVFGTAGLFPNESVVIAGFETSTVAMFAAVDLSGYPKLSFVVSLPNEKVVFCVSVDFVTGTVV